jgi:hypothetical protein
MREREKERETRKHWQWCGVVCGVSQIRCWRSVQNLLSFPYCYKLTDINMEM